MLRRLFALGTLAHRIEKLMATLQEQHDQLVGTLGTIATGVTGIQSQVTDLQAQIAALSAQHDDVDFSDVEASAQAIADSIAPVAAALPDTPAA